MRPRPGVWPVNPERLPDREAWLARYEEASRGYAACRFLETVGVERIDPAVAQIVQLHDEMSGALSDLPIA